jgi:hypothetical protein
LLGAALRGLQQLLGRGQQGLGARPAGGVAHQEQLVAAPLLVHLGIGVARGRTGREGAQLHQLAVEQGHGFGQHRFRLLAPYALAQGQIGLGTALAQHALAAGLVDGLVEAVDLCATRERGQPEQRQQGAPGQIQLHDHPWCLWMVSV